MNGILQIIASFIEAFAEVGAGFASTFAGYQPKVPDELED